jgi:hypothetical protein
MVVLHMEVQEREAHANDVYRLRTLEGDLRVAAERMEALQRDSSDHKQCAVGTLL